MPVLPAYTLIIIPLQSKVDARKFYSWLKQMKELEQQRDALCHGLEMVERARDWYRQEIRDVRHRQSYGSGSWGDEDYTSNSFLNRVNQLLDKIQHVNICLCNFISCAERMLQPPHSTEVAHDQHQWSRESNRCHQRAVAMLKQQNHLLTKEVSRKSQWITQLEKEKATLIKQLLDVRFQN